MKIYKSIQELETAFESYFTIQAGLLQAQNEVNRLRDCLAERKKVIESIISPSYEDYLSSDVNTLEDGYNHISINGKLVLVHWDSESNNIDVIKELKIFEIKDKESLKVSVDFNIEKAISVEQFNTPIIYNKFNIPLPH